MERRKAITTAAAASLTLLAGAAGIALNSGIVSADDDNVGQISPVDTTANPPITVYVDDPATTTTVASTPLVAPTNAQPVTTSAASGYQDDVRYEDEDGDDRYEHEREDEDHDEYEGAEDDD
jgi:hypothetical protein